MTPEGKVKDEIKKVLKHYGVYYFMPVQNGMGKPGLDFHCCHKGRALFIEAKAPGKHMTHRQEITAEEMRAAGGAVFTVSDMDTLKALTIWLKNVADNQRLSQYERN